VSACWADWNAALRSGRLSDLRQDLEVFSAIA
jgi:hypothetical protein